MVNANRFVKSKFDYNTGIYMIYNVDKKIAYIGKSEDLKRRCSNHKTNLLRGNHHCKLMQQHFDNGDRFVFVPIIQSSSNLIVLERFTMFDFRMKCVRLYNHESVEQLKDSLLWDFYHLSTLPNDYKITKEFGCPLASLERCKPETLIAKFTSESK